jgi:Flp pilus assembly protein TadG
MPAKKTKHTQYRRSRGQSLIEFALVLPVLLVLIISAIEIGRLFFTKIVITNGAREGAYYYATNPSDVDLGTLQTRATLAAQSEAQNSGVPVTSVVFTPIGSGTFSKIQVTVSATVQDLLILGFLGNVFSISGNYQDFTLSSSVEMMVQ